MKTHQIGIIGYGWVAGAHIAAINACSSSRVTRILSSRPLSDAEISAKHGSEIHCSTDPAAFFADPSIDTISICGYPNDHAKHAIAAARAGKNIIIEKPLALSWNDCLEIERAVAQAKVKTCVCLECRFSSQFLTTKAVIDRGLLGEIHYGEIDYYHGIGPWYGQFRWNTRQEVGGSSLLSAGCHALDALLLCMGSNIESVTSYAASSRSKDFSAYEYPTSSVTILKFQDGRIGKVASVIDCLQPYYFHVHLVGSEGSLLDNKFHSTKLGALNKNEWSELSMKLLDSGDVSDHPYQKQFQAFFDAVDRNEEMPLTALAHALETHRVIFAADRSAATGTTVRIADEP